MRATSQNNYFGNPVWNQYSTERLVKQQQQQQQQQRQVALPGVLSWLEHQLIHQKVVV